MGLFRNKPIGFLLLMCDNKGVAHEVKFTWDEAKRQANIAKRGLDIAVLQARFSPTRMW